MALFLAMVMCNSESTISAHDLEEAINARWPEVGFRSIAFESEDVFTLDTANGHITFGRMPVPIPWSNLEGPCETSLLWPNAAAEVQAHTSHWVIAVASYDTPVEQATLLTKVISSFMDVTPGTIGVYWGAATLLVPRNIFIEMAEEFLPDSPAMYLWVDYRIWPNPNGTSSGFTMGMRSLGHMEFVCENFPMPPGELWDQLVNFGSYVVENGPVLKDGDTIGGDADEQILVKYSKSQYGHKEPVILLDYSTASKDKPARKRSQPKVY